MERVRRNRKERKYTLGGFVPDPPPNCKSPTIIEMPDGAKWVDAVLCATFCHPNYCQVAKDYFKKLKAQRRKNRNDMRSV